MLLQDGNLFLGDVLALTLFFIFRRFGGPYIPASKLLYNRRTERLMVEKFSMGIGSYLAIPLTFTKAEMLPHRLMRTVCLPI